MTDRFVFVVAPYVIGAAAVPAWLARCALSTRRESSPDARRAGAGRDCLCTIWRLAIGSVAAGHLAALAFPEWILRWNQQPARLLVLETAGAIAGSAALAALVAISLRRGRSTPRVRSAADVAAWTLLVVGLASGVLVAAVFRWASSWSAVTVAPYVQSLLRLEPTTTLVERLPVLVRVHIFCAFAVAAVAPFTTLARSIVGPVERLACWTGSHVDGLRTASRFARDAASARLQPLSARVLRSDGEEN